MHLHSQILAQNDMHTYKHTVACMHIQYENIPGPYITSICNYSRRQGCFHTVYACMLQCACISMFMTYVYLPLPQLDYDYKDVVY